MKRPFSRVLADAFDRAAHDVAIAEQVHHHESAGPATRTDTLIYWCRGFVAGWVDDYRSLTLVTRFKQGLGRAFSRPQSR